MVGTPGVVLPSLVAALLIVTVATVISAEVDPNVVLPGDSVPPDTIRIIALGTGTPTVAADQVATSYLVQLGSTRNVLFDAGTGSIINLYATGVDLSTIDTVRAAPAQF